MRRMLRSTSCIITLSVSSRIRLPGASCDSSITVRTSSTKWGFCSWRAETLTEIHSGGLRGTSRCSSAALWQASRSTWRPSASTTPVSSAIGMKSIGMTMPRVGCSQRTSASMPAMSPRQIHDRLVAQGELAALQGAFEVGLELEPGQGLRLHLGLEDLVVALAVLLGHVHRRVGVAQQVVGVGEALAPAPQKVIPTLVRITMHLAGG